MCGYSWPNSIAKNSDFDRPCFILMVYKVVIHIFEGLLFNKDFFSIDGGKILQNYG